METESLRGGLFGAKISGLTSVQTDTIKEGLIGLAEVTDSNPTNVLISIPMDYVSDTSNPPAATSKPREAACALGKKKHKLGLAVRVLRGQKLRERLGPQQ